MTTAAIVLRTQNYGEADRIATLLLAERGRISAFAPSARRSRRRLGGSLELFVRADVVLSSSTRRPGAMPRIVEMSVVDARPAIRQDVGRMALASYVAECAMLVSREGEAAAPVFELVDGTLGRLGAAAAVAPPPELRAERHAFEARLLGALGYGLELRRCAACGRPLDGARSARVSAAGGGVLCASCLPSTSGTVAVSRASVDALAAVIEDPRAPLAAAGAAEWGALLARRMAELVDREPRSARFLDQLVREQEAEARAQR